MTTLAEMAAELATVRAELDTERQEKETLKTAKENSDARVRELTTWNNTKDIMLSAALGICEQTMASKEAPRVAVFTQTYTSLAGPSDGVTMREKNCIKAALGMGEDNRKWEDYKRHAM